VNKLSDVYCSLSRHASFLLQELKELLETTDEITKLVQQIQLLKQKNQLRKEPPVHIVVERAIQDEPILIVQWTILSRQTLTS